jgi:hypothetical protein
MTTYTYIIREVADMGSVREGTQITARDLGAAKRAARRAQMYQGTSLRIEAPNGCLLAYREPRGSWINYGHHSVAAEFGC